MTRTAVVEPSGPSPCISPVTGPPRSRAIACTVTSSILVMTLRDCGIVSAISNATAAAIAARYHGVLVAACRGSGGGSPDGRRRRPCGAEATIGTIDSRASAAPGFTLSSLRIGILRRHAELEVFDVCQAQQGVASAARRERSRAGHRAGCLQFAGPNVAPNPRSDAVRGGGGGVVQLPRERTARRDLRAGSRARRGAGTARVRPGPA